MIVRPNMYMGKLCHKHPKYKVESVTFVDYDGNECDPFNVPEDFWPTTITIHLGKRIR
ncbi:MAG: hypothetical protein IJR99_00205 [Kiritimatiellae bacterium]|nr:hypothetical protein [Kiritimatiellia bacterium]